MIEVAYPLVFTAKPQTRCYVDFHHSVQFGQALISTFVSKSESHSVLLQGNCN